MSPEQLAHVADWCGRAVTAVRWSDDPSDPGSYWLMAPNGEVLGTSLESPKVAAEVCRRMLASFERRVSGQPDAAERVAIARMLAAPPMRHESARLPDSLHLTRRGSIHGPVSSPAR